MRLSQAQKIAARDERFPNEPSFCRAFRALSWSRSGVVHRTFCHLPHSLLPRHTKRLQLVPSLKTNQAFRLTR
jgi:hypothetical protein